MARQLTRRQLKREHRWAECLYRHNLDSIDCIFFEDDYEDDYDLLEGDE